MNGQPCTCLDDRCVCVCVCVCEEGEFKAGTHSCWLSVCMCGWVCVCVHLLPDGHGGFEASDHKLNGLFTVAPMRSGDCHGDAGLAHRHPPDQSEQGESKEEKKPLLSQTMRNPFPGVKNGLLPQRVIGLHLIAKHIGKKTQYKSLRNFVRSFKVLAPYHTTII